MSEGIHSPRGRRKRLTTGHHSLDVAGGLAPIVLAFLAFLAAWHFETMSGFGIFLQLFSFGLALAGIAILGLRVQILNHRDYYGGLALVALALLAFWAGADLQGMRGFSFGAGTAPRLFAGVLAGVGGVITVTGLLTPGEPIGGYAVRGPVLVTAAIISFALLIRGFTFHLGDLVLRIPPFGLVIASFLAFMIAAAASKETRWVEATIIAAALTTFCVTIFVYLLGLPFQLWPRF